jgi:hypothetical protein
MCSPQLLPGHRASVSTALPEVFSWRFSFNGSWDTEFGEAGARPDWRLGPHLKDFAEAIEGLGEAAWRPGVFGNHHGKWYENRKIVITSRWKSGKADVAWLIPIIPHPSQFYSVLIPFACPGISPLLPLAYIPFGSNPKKIWIEKYNILFNSGK